MENNITSSRTKREILMKLISFTIVLLILTIPSIIFGIFIHESGHAISYLIMNPNVSIEVNIMEGWASWGFSSEFWWQRFISASAGILFSIIVFILVYKLILPKINRARIYIRLFIYLFLFVLISAGPLYLISAMIPGGGNDPENMSYSVEWYLNSIGIYFETKYIFGIIGIVLLVLLAYPLLKSFKKDLDPFFNEVFEYELENKKKWILNLTFISITSFYLSLFQYFIGLLYDFVYNTFSLLDYRTGTFRIDAVIVFAIIFIIFLPGSIFLNNKLVKKNLNQFYENNLKGISFGSILLVFLIISPGIIWNNPHTPTYTYSNYNQVTYYRSTYVQNAENIYQILYFNNRTDIFTEGSMQDYLGFAISKFNSSNYLWESPIVIKRFYRNLFHTASFCLDNQNKLWMLYVEFPDITEDISPSNYSSKVFFEMWDLNQISISNMNGSLLQFKPNQNFTLDFGNQLINSSFYSRLTYDDYRNIIWMYYYNYTTIDSYNIYAKFYNITENSWSNGNKVYITYPNSLVSETKYGNTNDEGFKYLSNGTIEFYGYKNGYSYNADLIRYQTIIESDIMQNWSEYSLSKMIFSKFLNNGNINNILFESERNVILFNEERDLWIQQFNKDWEEISEPLRLSNDYRNNYGILYKLKDKYYIKKVDSSSRIIYYLITENSSLNSWKELT